MVLTSGKRASTLTEVGDEARPGLDRTIRAWLELKPSLVYLVHLMMVVHTCESRVRHWCHGCSRATGKRTGAGKTSCTSTSENGRVRGDDGGSLGC